MIQAYSRPIVEITHFITGPTVIISKLRLRARVYRNYGLLARVDDAFRVAPEKRERVSPIQLTYSWDPFGCTRFYNNLMLNKI